MWVANLEEMKDFYVAHFGADCGPRYENAAKEFASYFLSFESGARLELMKKNGIEFRIVEEALANDYIGIAHLAFSTGSELGVERLTSQLHDAGIVVKSPPRWTGNGYYESVISDPEGNTIEITV